MRGRGQSFLASDDSGLATTSTTHRRQGLNDDLDGGAGGMEWLSDDLGLAVTSVGGRAMDFLPWRREGMDFWLVSLL
jgi:hypothetical protein